MFKTIKKPEYVDPRLIWAHEAKNFTPWLAANMDHLSESLGINITVRETEHPIGSFIIDILAEDDQGNTVIVENQLERTDHSHLGQIVTYSAGTDAKTIIWVTPEPRDEHAIAVQWLNEITPDDVRWYLVKLQAIKLSEDAVAPQFAKVIGPSEEIKSLGKEKKEQAERHVRRLEFWEGLLGVLNEKTTLYRNVKPTESSWLAAVSCVSRVYFQIRIRMTDASLMLVIEKKASEANKQIFDYLHQNQSEIEAAFGHPLEWQRIDDGKSSRIQFHMDGFGITDKGTWGKGQHEIAEKLVAFETRLRRIFSDFPRSRCETSLAVGPPISRSFTMED